MEDLKKALFYFGTSELNDKCGDTVPQTLNELQAPENKIPKFVKNGHSKKNVSINHNFQVLKELITFIKTFIVLRN